MYVLGIMREREERDFKFLVRILWLYFKMIFKFEFIDIILIYSKIFFV